MPGPTQGFAHQSSPCYWDKLFTTRRDFDPDSENQPYIEIWKSQESDVGDGSNDGTDSSNESLDKTDDKTKIEKEDKALDESDNHDNGDYDENNTVRFFMMDEDDPRLYLDQAEVIEGFCKGASLKDLQAMTQKKSEEAVALLDDRSITSGESRKYKGPLSQGQLYEELRRKVGQNHNSTAKISRERSHRRTHTVSSDLESSQTKTSPTKTVSGRITSLSLTQRGG